MTLQELYSFGNRRNIICAKSAYNGKILCKKFIPTKHAKIAQREVSSIWAEIRLLGSEGSGHPMAQAILCCYVDGREECEKAMEAKKNDTRGLAEKN